MSSSNESDPYLLPRDDIEFESLNKQHVLLMKRIYENRLLFDEAVKLGGDDCVLDAGAGTCTIVIVLEHWNFRRRSPRVCKSMQQIYRPRIFYLPERHLRTST